jgi:hypothetical protein
MVKKKLGDKIIDEMVASAKQYRKQKKYIDELLHYDSAIDSIITHSITKNDLDGDAINFINHYNFVDIIKRFELLFYKRLQEIRSDHEDERLSALCNRASIAGMCWFLKEDKLAKKVLTNSVDYLKTEYMSPIQASTIYAMDSFEHRKHYKYQRPKRVPKIEKPYYLYFELMNNIVAGHDLDSSLKDIDQNFNERMSDLGLYEPSPVLLGTGMTPAKWDFWKEAILSYARRHYKIEI